MHFQLLMLKALMRTQNISKFEVKWNIHFVIYMKNLIVMCNVKYVSKDSELNLEILLNQFGNINGLTLGFFGTEMTLNFH